MAHSTSLIRVAVVEDQKADLDALLETLARQPTIVCVGYFRSAETALAQLPYLKVDIVLMDIHLPHKSGIDCLQTLSPLMPGTQFMMLTVLEDHDAIYASLEAGATGYLLKKTSGPKIIEAIEELHQGGAPMSGQIARKVIAAFCSLGAANSTRKAPAGEPFEPLSVREEAILHRLGRGLLYKEIAAELNISVSTVNSHICHIYRKLQAHNRTQAINHSHAAR